MDGHGMAANGMRIRPALFGLSPPKGQDDWPQAAPTCGQDFKEGLAQHFEMELGSSPEVFERALAKVMAYGMFPPQRLRVDLGGASPLRVGGTIVMKARLGFLSFEIGNRVLDVFDRNRDGVREAGLTVATLQGHVEQGTETVTVRQAADGKVSLHLDVNARPGHWLTKAFKPLLLRVQRKAIRESLEHMQALCAQGPDIVFYDGLCGLCNRSVRFLLKRDPAGHLAFAPLQGETAKRLLPKGELPDSFVVWVAGGEGKLAVKSEACAYVSKWLVWPWNWLGLLAWPIPYALGDAVYDQVAKHRMRLFGRHDSCPLPAPGDAHRFLP